MENKIPIFLRVEQGHVWKTSLYQGPEDNLLIPGEIPLYINPEVKIARDGTIENMSSFKTLEAAFDFSRCLQCQELQLEHYGSSSESPCMACLGRVKKIKERNALHRLDPFDGAQARH